MLHILMPVAKVVSPQTQECLSSLQALGLQFRLYSVAGFSDVGRARQEVATAAYVGGRIADTDLVLWLDADMVLYPKMLTHQMRITFWSGVPTSALYSMRQNPGSAAISRDPNMGIDRAEVHTLHGGNKKVTHFDGAAAAEIPSTMQSYFSETTVCTYTLYKTRGCGMGSLMMMGGQFKRQVEASPLWKEGPHSRYLVCAPRVETIEGSPVYLSEDFDYCRSLGGVYAIQVKEEFTDGSLRNAWVVAGHVVETVAVPNVSLTALD